MYWYWWQYCWQKKLEEIMPYWYKPHHKLHMVQVRTLVWEAPLWQASILLPTLWNGYTVQVKGKGHPRTGHKGGEEVSSTLSLTSALDGGGWDTHAPNALPSEKTRYPLYRMLDGPQDRSGWVQKISPPTGIRSPDRPARRELLYRLHYPGPRLHITLNKQSWNNFTLL